MTMRLEKPVCTKQDPMEHKQLRVLLVEDSPDDAELILCELAQGGLSFDSTRVESAEEMSTALFGADWDIVLSDYSLPNFSAPEALALLQASEKDIPFIIVSGCVGDEAAVAMMKAGAHDFIIKGSLARLVPAVNRCLLETETHRQCKLAQAALQKSEARFRALAANIPGMVFQLLLEDGTLRFPYVSEGCQAVFGISPRMLQDNPGLLLDMIVAEDRSSYIESLDASATNLTILNWEGRIRVGPKMETKWINLRASPRRSFGSDNSIIWDGIAANITANKTNELRIKQSEEQLRQLSAHIETLKEEERARVSREIHDDLGGTLTAIKMELMWFASKLPQRSKGLLTKIASLDRLVDHAIEASVRIAADLRPGILDCGIVAAIQWQTREFQDRTGIKCKIYGDEDEVTLSSESSIAVFRIFQETLTNISKHANASAVDIKLKQADGSLILEISDNGRGIREADRSKPLSFGIRGMLERSREFGGDIKITGAAGRGTQVSVRVPLVSQKTGDREFEHQHRLF